MNKKIFAVMFAFVLVINLSFLAKALVISSINSPGQIGQGDSGNIGVTLKNDGNNDVIDVSVALDLSQIPFASLYSSSIKSVGEILEDDSKTFDFSIQALGNAKSGNYKIPITVTYTEDVTPSTPAKQISGLISVTVNSVPILDVQRESGLLLKGQENTVTFQIVNKGLSDIQFLEASLDDSGGYSVTSPKKVYIGTLASDDTDTAQFTIYINPTSSDIVSFPVILVYNDITNQKYTNQFSIDARAYSRDEALSLGLIQKSNTALYIILIIILIILYLVYRRIKKALKNRKKARETAS